MGNPGVLRQLVETARQAGVLTELNGVWRLVGPLQPTASFEDLVAERLRGLDDAHHHAAELLAIAGEIGLDILAAVAGHDVLEDLERHGLLTVRYSGRRAGLSLAHPLFAEVLLRQLPALRGRRLRRELAEALEAVGARRRDDRVRLVAWRLDAGGAVDREDVLHAARLALLEGDDAIAERLVRRAAAAGGGARAMELLAELHFRRNEPERLEAVLAGIDLDELPEADRVRVVRRRSSNRFYALTDADGALAVLDETAHFFSAPWAVHALAAHRATILSMAGRVDDALCCTEPLLDTDDPRLRFEVLRARSLALAAAGRGEEALVLIDEASDIHDRFDRDLTRPGRSILLFNQIFSLTELGRLDEARAAGAAAAAGDVVGGRVSWLAFARPRVELLAGDAAAALDAERAVRARGPRPWRVRCRAVGAVARRHGPAPRRRQPRAGAATSIESPSSGPRRATAACSAAIATGRWVGRRWSDRVRTSRTRCSCAARGSRRSGARTRSRRCCATTSSGSAVPRRSSTGSSSWRRPSKVRSPPPAPTTRPASSPSTPPGCGRPSTGSSRSARRCSPPRRRSTSRTRRRRPAMMRARTSPATAPRACSPNSTDRSPRLDSVGRG